MAGRLLFAAARFADFFETFRVAFGEFFFVFAAGVALRDALTGFRTAFFVDFRAGFELAALRFTGFFLAFAIGVSFRPGAF